MAKLFERFERPEIDSPGTKKKTRKKSEGVVEHPLLPARTASQAKSYNCQSPATVSNISVILEEGFRSIKLIATIATIARIKPGKIS